ncbi:MAG: hypothetical protein GY888_04300, partial [Planctomycetaceae bacterium]|nr:hypothetical protein [Planctomycetaceae bacterium]
MRHLKSIIAVGLAIGFSGDCAVAGDPSDRPGMGAIPYQDKDGTWGTMFRTWAPNATSVSVAGSFNGWSSTQYFLSSEGDGVWSMEIPLLPAGEEYQFIIRQPGVSYWRNDPYARQLTQSDGVSIIYDSEAFVFETVDFVTPAFNDWVIYEMHVGTFSGGVGGSL